MRFLHFATAIFIPVLTMSMAAQRRVPKDLSNVRGFNYQSAETIGHAEFWLQYNPAVTMQISRSDAVQAVESARKGSSVLGHATVQIQ